MKYIVGIDAGGTKTECVLVSDKLDVIYTIRGEGFNLSVHGIQTAYGIVKKLLNEIKLKFGENYKLTGFCIAAAGAGRDELRASFQKLLTENLMDEYAFVTIKVITDAEAALEGAFAGEPGFILISGTGSILFGKDEKGNVLRTGGYGRVIGDGGSGYSIGRKAFIYLSEVLDGIQAEGILSSELIKTFGIVNSNDLISILSNPSFNIADAALLVLNAAANKDTAALSIIAEEADSLCRLINGMQKKTGQSNFKIALCGSLIANDNIYSKALLFKIASVFPDIVIIKPEHSPAIGAALSVLKEM